MVFSIRRLDIQRCGRPYYWLIGSRTGNCRFRHPFEKPLIPESIQLVSNLVTNSLRSGFRPDTGAEAAGRFRTRFPGIDENAFFQLRIEIRDFEKRTTGRRCSPSRVFNFVIMIPAPKPNGLPSENQIGPAIDGSSWNLIDTAKFSVRDSGGSLRSSSSHGSFRRNYSTWVLPFLLFFPPVLKPGV
jgi:hypothetical protein